LIILHPEKSRGTPRWRTSESLPGAAAEALHPQQVSGGPLQRERCDHRWIDLRRRSFPQRPAFGCDIWPCGLHFQSATMVTAATLRSVRIPAAPRHQSSAHPISSLTSRFCG